MNIHLNKVQEQEKRMRRTAEAITELYMDECDFCEGRKKRDCLWNAEFKIDGNSMFVIHYSNDDHMEREEVSCARIKK